MPGFGPAAELVAWCVPKGATSVVEQKDPKPLTPRLAILNGLDANVGGQTNSLRSDKACL
jgi:hypothetical protein